MTPTGKAMGAIGSILIAMTPSLALAASILVNTADDELNGDGDCSLREAVAAANTNAAVDECNAGSSGSDPDTITLLVTGTMTLDDGELEVLESLNVIGPGAGSLTIEAGVDSRHFYIDMPANSYDFSIAGVTLSGGAAYHGGAILAQQVGTLALERVRLTGNQAAFENDSVGGAIALMLPANNDSRLEIHESVIENNTSEYRGGAIHIAGLTGSRTVETIDIQRSLFRDNLANGSGGAIYAIGVPTVVIEDCLFEANKTSFDAFSGGEFGGAIYWSVADFINPFMQIDRTSFIANDSWSPGGAVALFGGTTAVINSTFEGNRERANGGEAFNLRSAAELFLFHTTLTNNGSGYLGHTGDVAIEICDDCSLALTHSIIWTDWDADTDCETGDSGVVTSNGHNIDGTGTCTGHATDLPSTDPQLWPLSDYGDAATGIVIPTRLPRPDSATVDAGAAACTGLFGVPLNEDQRGQARPVTGPGGSAPACDIGAVEYQPGDPVPRTVTVTLAGTGQVDSNPAGIDCPAQDCSAEFPSDTGVTLSASTGPEPGVIFAGWSGDCSGTGDCLLTMDADKNVTATFNVATDEVFADRFEDSP